MVRQLPINCLLTVADDNYIVDTAGSVSIRSKTFD
jgi:hypothetical protein